MTTTSSNSISAEDASNVVEDDSTTEPTEDASSTTKDASNVVEDVVEDDSTTEDASSGGDATEVISGFYNWTWNAEDVCYNGGGNPSTKHNIGILFNGSTAKKDIYNYIEKVETLKNCDEKTKQNGKM